jgi:Tfp pilus assembly protein PilE
MIVIAIIGILAAVMFPSVSNYFMRARDVQRIGDLRAIKQALEAYYIDKEIYPPS